MSAFHELLVDRPRGQIAAVALLGVAGIGMVDQLTGYELSLSILYLLPVAVASWYADERTSTLVCVVSAATWLASDFGSGHPYSHPAIPYWNAIVRLGFFAVTANLLIRLRAAFALQASLAQNDGLTGIPNARTFRARYDSVAQLGVRHGRSLVLGYLDLDDFKSVNDGLGHGAGDEVLKAVASALAGRLRASDLVARMGGDEFAILLPETNLAGARVFFDEMRARLRGLAARNGWPVGFSIGVAVFHSPPASAEDAIRVGDALMYGAKRKGRNGIVFEEVGAESSDALRAVPNRA